MPVKSHDSQRRTPSIRDSAAHVGPTNSATVLHPDSASPTPGKRRRVTLIRFNVGTSS